MIDAYHGTVDLYIVDDSDPIIQVWKDIFPDLFKPTEQFPGDLQQHWRYPQDYFQIQADQYLTYHIESARGLFNRETSGRSRKSYCANRRSRSSPIT